ncbi:E3 ubiquitin-protein ligase DTX3L-like isoform X2 [Centroberyx affinis]|uniref:E3 ubiquitin-protein ligase DTX3L-like isoform X2 n=1 Tax=Centroberyx affinis TaxID=166261 RepID=UPI003A5BCC45
MDDAYPHALLVELGENNVPKLKNKLVKYFQSKKSNGGDCRVEHEDRSGTAVLYFRTEEDRQRVLGKEGHEINLDKGVLKITVRLPNDEKSPKQEPSSENLKTSDDAANNKGTGGDGGTPQL